MVKLGRNVLATGSRTDNIVVTYHKGQDNVNGIYVTIIEQNEE